MQDYRININDVQLAKDGDKEMFEKIMNSVKDQLFHIALAIAKNRQDAEDALQETFLKAYMNMHRIKYNEFFYTWVTRILINNARSITKKNKRYLLQENVEAIYKEPLNEEEILIKELLDHLQEKERIVIYLRFYGGFDLGSIARSLHSPESTGLAKLRKEFDEKDEKEY